jgi:hypothetical protein
MWVLADLNGNWSCILFNSRNGIRRGIVWTNLLECQEVLANNVPLLECYIQVACLYLKWMIQNSFARQICCVMDANTRKYKNGKNILNSAEACLVLQHWLRTRGQRNTLFRTMGWDTSEPSDLTGQLGNAAVFPLKKGKSTYEPCTNNFFAPHIS